MSKMYIVPEERLLELLEAEARLQCLEQDGVDNWSWYMEGKTHFLAECLNLTEEEIEENEVDFSNLAEIGLEEFQKYDN